MKLLLISFGEFQKIGNNVVYRYLGFRRGWRLFGYQPFGDNSLVIFL